MKFLGLLLDKNLSFQSHIKHISAKVLKGIYALSQASKVLPSKDLKTLHSALVLPYLNYGLLSWGGSLKSDSKYIILHRGQRGAHLRHLTSVHKLYKRSVRLVAKAKSRSHHIPLCFKLRILDLPDLYNIKALSFFHDFFHGKLPPVFSNIFSLQFNRNIQIIIKTKYRRTDTAASYIIHTVPDIWNSLDQNLRILIFKSKSTFINHCKDYVINLYANWTCHKNNCFVCT